MNVLQWARALFKGLFQTEKENFVDYVCGDGEALPLPLSPEAESEKLRLMLDKAGRESEWRGATGPGGTTESWDARLSGLGPVSHCPSLGLSFPMSESCLRTSQF